MLNRIEAPQYKAPDKLYIPDEEKSYLNNGIPVGYVHGGSQEVCKIDFVFAAGVIQSNKPLVASFTNNLMREGTENYSAFEIAEKVDYYGAFLGQSTNYHHAQVTLYCLSKYLPELLPVMEEIIKRPLFTQHEFDIYLEKKKHEFLVDSEKVKTLAFRRSQEILFTDNHPYGRVAHIENFDLLSVEDIKQFHKQQYASNLCTILVAGQAGEEFLPLLNQYFGGDDWGNQTKENHQLPEPKGAEDSFELVEKADAMQSAIRLVRHMVTKDHPDYLPLQVLNTLLGGYFGSRLMNNLREEKGLTYGISSFIVSFLKAGVFSVATEVVAEKRELAVNEIFSEMETLQTEKVDDEELSRVKNYMLGELLRNLDGPFAVSDAYRGMMGFDIDIQFYHRFVETINKITPDEIQVLAQKYLNRNDFYTVIAGK